MKINKTPFCFLTPLFTFLFFLLFFFPSPIFSQSKENNSILNSNSLKGLKYRLIGPYRGGRVTTVAGVPDQLFTFYMGATGGGVWKTTDGGLSWQNISDGYIKAGSIGAVTVAPSDPNVIYVGTGSADPRGNVSAGCGMYKSTDSGESWQFIGLPNAGQIGKIVVHPSDPNHVFAAVLGNVFGPSEERGIYRSKDGGINWEKIHFIDQHTGAIDIEMDPSNPRILYAGMWQVERKPWTIIDGGKKGGVWKSTDSGDSWKRVKGGLPDGILGRVGIAISPANPKRIWVLQETKEETKGGLYRSDDGGKSWKRINRNHNLRQRAWYYTRVFADPKNENTVYIVNVGFHKSIDGGNSFQRIQVPHGDNHYLWINPTHPKIMVEGNDGGACVTFNGGKSWTTQNNQPTSEFYRVTVDNQFPYRVYGAQQDNSTISVASRGSGGLTPTQDWYAVGGGESGHIAVDPRNPNLIYAGTYIGQITRREMNKGHQRDIVAYPQMHDGTAPRDIKYRFQWNAPIRLSPHNPDILYHCSQYVHRTKDGGKTWEIISPDLTTNNDEYHDIPGEPVQHDHTGVELYTTIFAFEESSLQAGELWAGSDDGLLHISRDNGQSWTNITPKNLPKEGTINMIDLSTTTPGRALIAVYKYRENDFNPYVFLTNDYGKNWKKLTNGQNGIPNNHFVRVVREDPKRKGLLYAGTEFGMYISLDEGNSWKPFQLNLPITPITDMLIKEDDLVIATQGRSFWILDDLSPLRELSKEVLAQKGYLFKPKNVYRTQLRNSRGIGAPDRAPNGAIIYFYLKEAPDSANIVSLSILDRDGKARRVFSTKPDKDKKEEKLNAHKGLNRFQWNLNYEAPIVQKGAVFSLAYTGGMKAPTGKHKVVLKVGSLEIKQDLLLKKDPRWTQSDEDLYAQYQLGMEIKEKLNECHAAIGQIRSIRDQIKAIGKRVKQPGLGTEIKAKTKPLIKDLTQLENQLIQRKSESGQDPINYPSMLDDQFAYLYSVVNFQDDRPNQGAYARFEDLKKELAKHLTKLENIVSDKVTPFNEYLKSKKVEIITTK